MIEQSGQWMMDAAHEIGGWNGRRRQVIGAIIAKHAPRPTQFYSEDGNTLYDGPACLARTKELEAALRDCILGLEDEAVAAGYSRGQVAHLAYNKAKAVLSAT